MFPVLFINTLLYIAANLFWRNKSFSEPQTEFMQTESFSYHLAISLVGVWIGKINMLNIVEWTMKIEFVGSFLVYLTVMTLYSYKNRYFIYFALMAFFGVA